MDQLFDGPAAESRSHGRFVSAGAKRHGDGYLQIQRHQGGQVPVYRAELLPFPALWPDVSAIHVHEADIYGNCRVKGISIADFELARASKHLIITCERLVHNEEIRRDPTATVIPYYCVDAVCEFLSAAIRGIWPTNISPMRII